MSSASVTIFHGASVDDSGCENISINPAVMLPSAASIMPLMRYVFSWQHHARKYRSRRRQGWSRWSVNRGCWRWIETRQTCHQQRETLELRAFCALPPPGWLYQENALFSASCPRLFTLRRTKVRPPTRRKMSRALLPSPHGVLVE